MPYTALKQYHSFEEKRNYYELTIVNNMKSLAEILNNLYHKSLYSGPFFFRGVSNASFRMYSSMQRCYCKRKNDGMEVEMEDLTEEIISRFNKSKILTDAFCKDLSRNKNYNNILLQSENSDLAKWAFIQHFGGPSHFVDFTYDLNTALFIAIDNQDFEQVAYKCKKRKYLEDYFSIYAYQEDREKNVACMIQHDSENCYHYTEDYKNHNGNKPLTKDVDTESITHNKLINDKNYWGGFIKGDKIIPIISPGDGSTHLESLNNTHISIQRGNFFFGNPQEFIPLEYAHSNYKRYCIDIHKSLIPTIRKFFRIPEEEEVYTKSDYLKEAKEELKNLWEPELLQPNTQHSEPQPLVSVFALTYNHKEYIARALNSILMQKTDFPIEIIVHDDCSTDGTTDIVCEYAAKYPEIVKPIIESVNLYSTHPNAFEYYGELIKTNCRGRYVAMLECDDYWRDPMKLQKQASFLEKHPEVGFAGSSYQVRLPDGIQDKIENRADEYWEKIDKREETDEYGEKWYLCGKLFDYAKYGNLCHTSTLIFRKAIVEKLTFFNIQDIVFHGILAHDSEFAMLDHATSVYNRANEGAITADFYTIPMQLNAVVAEWVCKARLSFTRLFPDDSPFTEADLTDKMNITKLKRAIYDGNYKAALKAKSELIQPSYKNSFYSRFLVSRLRFMALRIILKIQTRINFKPTYFNVAGVVK